MNFSPEELIRYSRHLNLPGFDLIHQEKLKAAKVLVVGAGGLGSPLIQYLAAAGVGEIGIIDPDKVGISNLQRQTLYRTADVGKPKARIAAETASQLNPHIRVKSYQEALTSENALKIIENYDIVADGADNFPARYLVSDACVLLGKINVHASIFRFEGQVSVFNYPEGAGRRGPNYRDLFPSPPPANQVLSCEEGGVLGVLAGVVGSMQALEVLKVILNLGDVLSGKLWMTNTLTHNTHLINLKKNKDNPVSGENPTIHSLIDYEVFCGTRLPPEVSSITAATLKEWMNDSDEHFQLIDVREKAEYDQWNIGGLLIPLSQLEDKVLQIDRDRTVVIHCQSGVRSKKAIRLLSEKYGFTKLVNLERGLAEW